LKSFSGRRGFLFIDHYIFVHKNQPRKRYTSIFGGARGKPPGYRAVSFQARRRAHHFNAAEVPRPERILAHIPHALRLVHSDYKSGDQISTARP